MSIQKRSRRVADRAGGESEPNWRFETQFHPPQFFQHFFCSRKEADLFSKELGRDLAPALHHFFSRHGDVERSFEKLDREPVAHAENLFVIFTVIFRAVLGEQLRVDLVPPGLGISEHAIEIEDYGMHAGELMVDS